MEQEVPEDEAGTETYQAQGQTLDIVIHVHGSTLISSVVLVSHGSILAGHGHLRIALRSLQWGQWAGWQCGPLGRAQRGCYPGLGGLRALTRFLVVELRGNQRP